MVGIIHQPGRTGWELALQAKRQVRDLMWQMAFEGTKEGCKDDLMHRLGRHLAIGWRQPMHTSRWLKVEKE